MASPQIKSAPHPSGVDLCPLERWNVALHVLLSRLRNGTLERAGGYMALLSEYEKRFSGHRCTHLAPANGPDFASSLVGVQGWPPSRRSSAASVRPPLLIGMGDGTTGTRFLACVFRMLKMETYHNNPYPKESVNLTAWFDAFAAVLDSPIPYMLDALLATHAANETALFITVRDPWDWVRSRRAHHLPEAEHWSASTGGCGTNGVLIGRDETSNDEVARNLLVEWAWATCGHAARRQTSADPQSLRRRPVHVRAHDEARYASSMGRSAADGPRLGQLRSGPAPGLGVPALEH